MSLRFNKCVIICETLSFVTLSQWIDRLSSWASREVLRILARPRSTCHERPLRSTSLYTCSVAGRDGAGPAGQPYLDCVSGLSSATETPDTHSTPHATAAPC